ncbi:MULTISPECIES: MFS transporter [unclassified Microbacterium]|uniref:MFS transporter n=1 Tax=unclassified Microbacterium TaxID=2609290 RepID=UPI000A9D294D|nr:MULTISPECIES: MFS transporter [unclassified Microbacterium]
MKSERERHERVVVALLAACGMLTSLQFTLIVPLLPLVPELLDTTAADASWLITVTLLAGVVGTPVVTRLADMHGRRLLLLVSMGLLVIGSVIAAVISGFTAVLIGRALQGFGTAVVPIGIGLLSALVSRRRAVLGIALMSGTLGMGSALGLVLAGPLLEWGGLPTVFWCSAVVGALFCVLIRVRIPEAPTGPSRAFDLIGAVLLTLGLTALLLAISRGQYWGWASPLTLGFGLLAVATLVLWMLWERRHPAPLIDVRTAMRAPILPINIASFFATFGMYANHLLTTQEALAPTSTGYGLDVATAAAGLFLLPSALTMIALAPLAARVITRFGGQRALLLGSAMMAFAFLLRVLFHGGALPVLIGSALVGAGVAFAFAAMPSLITASVPSDEVATANGVNSVIRTLSGAVAAALFAFVIAALPSTADPAFLSERALQLSLGFAAACGVVTAVLAAFLRLPHSKEPA